MYDVDYFSVWDLPVSPKSVKVSKRVVDPARRIDCRSPYSRLRHFIQLSDLYTFDLSVLTNSTLLFLTRPFWRHFLRKLRKSTSAWGPHFRVFCGDPN